MNRDVLSIQEYPYTIEATALGGATATVSSNMEVNNDLPAPVIIPTETITDYASGAVLEVFEMGDLSVPISNSNEGDGNSYISEI